MCEGETEFHVDTDSKESIATSMGRAVGSNMVAVPTINLLRLLYEHVQPEVFVILDMDIEGAEFDILPCLARSPAAALIDELYMEVHLPCWSKTHPRDEEMRTAVTVLQSHGVVFPDYSEATAV